LIVLLNLFLQITIGFGQTEDIKENIEQKNMSAKKWLTSDQLTANQEKYDVSYYLIDFDYNYNVKQNVASPVVITEIKMVITEGPLNEIDLNFAHDYTIDSITVNNHLSNFSHENSILNVQLDQVYSNQETVSILVYYRSNSWNLGEDYNGKPLFWTIFEPYGAKNLFPCKDTPADKADSADIKITVPAGMVAVSNGLLFKETSKGRSTTYWWKTQYPIATYLFFIAAYEYSHYRDWYVSVTGDSMPIDFYVVPDHMSNSMANFYETKNIISIFADLFGEYPFIKEKYGHVEIIGGTSMEHQTCSSLGMFASNDGDYPMDLIAHELAHQWWGDMITCDNFHDIWLNEGFATYSEALYYEATGGKELYNSVMTGNAYYGSGTIYVEDPENDNIFDYRLSYKKAAYVLHMLRNIVGDIDFFEILRVYARDIRYKYNSVVTQDFKEICEDVSGINLDKFFQQWIYNEYYPHYSYGWSVKTLADGYNLKIRIDQIQDNTGLFRMPIDLEIRTNSYNITFLMQDSLQSQSVEFFISEEPLSVHLDPENWILKRTETGVIFPYPFAENVKLNSNYQKPGDDVLAIKCGLINPDNDNVEVTALIENYDQSSISEVTLFDDGMHNDSMAGDGIFGASWAVPSEENWYHVSIKTMSLNSGYSNILSDQASFTTVGPVALSEYEIINRDTLVNPDDFLRIDFTLYNNGITDTVFNVSTKTTSLDPCVQIIAFSDPLYGNIAPGEFSRASRPITILFADDCDVPENTSLVLDIYSENNFLWSDTFSVEIISKIRNDKSKLAEKFVLHQNYPNPFNPSTVISYNLPEISDVELSIYNILGEKVTNLVAESQKSGYYWVEWDASGYASGVYYYRLSAKTKTQNVVQTRKLILLK
jgi:hypothetical protein